MERFVNVSILAKQAIQHAAAAGAEAGEEPQFGQMLPGQASGGVEVGVDRD